MFNAQYIDLDGAWSDVPAGLSRRDLTAWGPRLRYCAPRGEVEAFDREVGAELPPFILYGSGDFHYLAGLWLRRTQRQVQAPLTLVSFDNHPDWDVRPPYWACGGWICRALELPNVSGASVWGCGNFELRWPSRLFANKAAIKDGRLVVHGWAERQPPRVCRRFNCMKRAGWRQRFEAFVEEKAGQDLYVTVDLDCLDGHEAVTNWENGLFTAEDVAWAIERLRARCEVAGGDLCGAWSAPVYARWRQRLAGNWDHPNLPSTDPERTRAINNKALRTIWPVLIGAAVVR